MSMSMSTTSEPIMKTVFGVERNIEESNFPSDDEIQKLESMLPKGCIHGWFPSCYCNKQLHYRKWIASSSPKAVVIFMHGICTHSVKYIPLLDDGNRKVSTMLMVDSFLQNNISVYAFDLYGHGYSEGIRSYIPDTYQNNVNDYITFCHLVAQENTSNAPIFLMGESYGSTLTLFVAHHFQQEREQGSSSILPNFDSIILTAPAIIGDVPIYPVLQILILLAKYYPVWRPFFMPNPVSVQRIWRDPVVQNIYLDKTNPANIVDGQGIPFRLGTGLNLLNALANVRQHTIPALTVPYLALHGTNDYGVPIKGSEYLHKTARSPDKEFIRKDGAYHDLLADPLAEECMNDIISWINKRVKSYKK